MYLDFRAFHIKENKYYTVLNIDFEVGTVILRDYETLYDDEENDNDVILEPCIGLKDINKKDIFVGDRVLWHKDGRTYKGCIIFAKQVAKFMFKCEDNNAFDFKTIQADREIEIVGNIHDK